MPRRWSRALARPVDGASIAVFRIAFGLLIGWQVLRHFTGGGIGTDYADPAFHFAYFGLDWLRPWPDPWTHVHFALLGVLGLGIALGLYYRVCAALFFAGFALVFLWDKASYQNHNYLICLLAALMCYVPAQRVASLDRLRKRGSDSSVPCWALWVLRFQVAIPYTFGGIAKLRGDWLQGQPLTMWLAERTSFPLLGRYFEEPWMVRAFTWGGLCFDLLIVPLLLFKRTRGPAFVGVVLFHLLNAKLFSIGVFPWLMIAGTTLFFPPDWPRRLHARFTRAKLPSPSAEGCVGIGSLALLSVWVALQLLLPLRHFLYPGRVDWTEEGHRFAWHMKLRDKSARIYSITLRDVRTGATRGIDPRDYLTNRQITEMCMHPEMIRQFARHVAAQAEAAGVQAEIRADIHVSLNGRAFQPIIDREVDLADVKSAADWIVPLSEGGEL